MKKYKIMTRGLSILLVAVILMAAFSLCVYAADLQDFTTFTEYDPGSKVAVTSSNVTWTNLLRSDTAYVYKDMGVDFFSGDFNINFTLVAGSMAANSEMGVLMLSNTANATYREHTVSPKYDSISVGLYMPSSPAEKRLALLEVADGTATGSGTYYVISDSSPRYITITRDESIGDNGTAYMYIYLDAARTNLAATQSIALFEKEDFRYLYAMDAYTNTGSYASTGSISVLSLLASEPVADTLDATDVEWNGAMARWEATLNGYVTSDGGDACTAGFLYREKDSSDNWSWAGVSGYYSTGDNFTSYILSLASDKDWEYKAYLTNEAGTVYGDLVYFDTYFEASNPEMVTYGFPIDLDFDNVTARLYGRVLYDGSSNVTAYFRYRVEGTEGWWYSDNVTDLQTGDAFDFLVSDNLSLLTTFEFQAAGLNDSGYGYGGIATFALYPSVETPVVTSDNVTGIGSGDCWLHGTVVDDGDGDGEIRAWAGFQYRPVGSSVWLKTPIVIVDSGDTYLAHITGLQPEVNYEWRAFADNALLPANQAPTGYGDIKTFHTYESQRPPVIISENSTWISSTSTRLLGLVEFDGGYSVSVWFEYRLHGYDTGYQATGVATGAYTDDEFIQIIFDLEPERWYDWRAAGSNELGTSYGSVKSFYTGLTAVDDGTGETPEMVSGFAETLRDWMDSMGMDNPSGHWAFMFMLMLLTAIGFSIGIIASKERFLKIVFAVILAVLELTIFGTFIFSGLLGIWPALILIFVAVGLAIVFGGRLITVGRA